MPAKRLLPAIATNTALTFLMFLAACHQRSDKHQLLTINEGLTRSFAFIQNNTDVDYHLLQGRLADPQTKYWADQWAPAAFSNKDRTKDIIGYIDTLEAGLNRAQQLPTETTKALFDTLIRYKHALTSAFPDSLIEENQYRKKDWEDFSRNFPLLRGFIDSTFENSKLTAWADTSISEDPLLTLLALNKLKIDIAGSVQPLNSSAYAEYVFKAPKQPGRHSIPIKIEYYKPDGTLAWFERTVIYEVSALPATPGQ
jgi:hypothetical protein